MPFLLQFQERVGFFFIAGSGHQNVWGPGVLEGAACVARGSQRAMTGAAALCSRCVRGLELCCSTPEP